MLKVAFVRNILFLSILGAIALPLFETYFIHPAYQKMVIEQTEQEAIRYGNYLINTLDLDRSKLQPGKLPAEVDRDVGVMRKDRQLIKLRVFSAAGEIIYSTKQAELGQLNRKDYFTQIVAGGDYFSKVVQKDHMTADGTPAKRDVVETYVPIMVAGEFVGAIEVYYDTTQALASLQSLTHRSHLVLIVIACGLYFTIVAAVRKAYHSLRAQQRSEQLLVEANEELEQRVAERTKALESINAQLHSEVGEHRRTTSELRKANKFNRTVINSLSDAVSIIDAATFRVVDYNSVFKRSLRPEVGEIVGNTCHKLIHDLDAPCDQPGHDCPLRETVMHGSYASFDHSHTDKDGTVRHVEVSTSPIFDDSGEVVQVVHVNRDVTERKNAAAEIEQMAFFDQLTNLPNRRLLHDRLEKAMFQAIRRQGKLALLFLDLDRFKEINDNHGHSCGDQLLQAVAARLQQIVRGCDTLARLGGDEFVLLLTSIDSLNDACVVAEKVLEIVREPIPLEEIQLHMTTSVGIALYPNDGADGETLLKNADMALYDAKVNGRNGYRFFSEKLNQQAQDRHQLENSMHRALQNDEFFLLFQPQVDLQTLEVVGVEALLRWQDPQCGLVSPARFIPVAEESGLVLPIGDQVLLSACRQAQDWRSQGGSVGCMAVNISVRQFQHPGFVAKVQQVLQETALPPELLELELTESLLMQNGAATVHLLKELKQLGVRLSIDDFGTGYSSLSYLKNFPIDRIKIDQSFVRDINKSSSDRVIVKTIIAMAEQLGMEVIAEGVENEAQREVLISRNCFLAQGFLFARPLPAKELPRYVNKG